MKQEDGERCEEMYVKLHVKLCRLYLTLLLALHREVGRQEYKTKRQGERQSMRKKRNGEMGRETEKKVRGGIFSVARKATETEYMPGYETYREMEVEGI